MSQGQQAPGQQGEGIGSVRRLTPEGLGRMATQATVLRLQEKRGRQSEQVRQHLFDYMVNHPVSAKSRSNDDGVKSLKPMFDGIQRLVKNFLLLILC